MKIYISSIILVLLIGLLTTSCNPQILEQNAELDSTIPSTAYPISTPMIAVTDLNNSYPMNASTEVMEPTLGDLLIPTPAATTGVVTGTLKDIGTENELVNQTIFLGDVIYPTIGTGFSVGIDQSKSPNTVTNYKGEFYLSDVEPGEYVLMAWTPFQSSLVLDSKNNGPMVIVVVPNMTTNLGIIKVINPNR